VHYLPIDRYREGKQDQGTTIAFGYGGLYGGNLDLVANTEQVLPLKGRKWDHVRCGVVGASQGPTSDDNKPYGSGITIC